MALMAHSWHVVNLPHDSTCVDLAAMRRLAYTPRLAHSLGETADSAEYCGFTKPAEWNERIIHSPRPQSSPARLLAREEWSPDRQTAHPAHPPRARKTGTGGYRQIWVTADRRNSDGSRVSASVRKVYSATDRNCPDTDRDAKLCTAEV